MTEVQASSVAALDVEAPGARPTDILTVRQLMLRKFLRNRLAVFGTIVLIIMYLLAAFAPFVAPYDVRETHEQFPRTAPSTLHFTDEHGRFQFPPFVYATAKVMDPKTFTMTVKEDTSAPYPVRFLAHGTPYTLFGFIKGDIHLFGVDAPAKIFLMGTDGTGRDLFSRILFGSQVSLTVGLFGVVLALVIGTGVGIISGYYGGWFDEITQRIIEMTLAFPQIPLWLALATLVPPTLNSVTVYFAISIVLSILSWGALARQVRAMVLALKTSEFVRASGYANASAGWIMTRHLLPNTMSHVLVIATLTIPSMILGETALSFLGLGIKTPMTSWGVLLNEAQNVQALMQLPWLLWPAAFVILTIISFNFVGDGLRDAADPFSR
jgi:peptide/nickel transport system permease protein